MKQFFITLIVSAVLICAANHALAFAFISNLSDKPQQFLVQSGAKEYEITIEPGERWRTMDVELQVKPLDGTDRLFYIRRDDHFVYWQDGTFGRQIRRRNSGVGSL